MADIKAIKGTNDTTYSIVDRFSKWGGYNILPGTKDWTCFSESSIKLTSGEGTVPNPSNMTINNNELSTELNVRNRFFTTLIPYQKGETFSISVKIKSNAEVTYTNASNSVTDLVDNCWLFCYFNSDKEMVAHTQIIKPSLTLTTDWQTFSKTLTLPDGAAYGYDFSYWCFWFKSEPHNDCIITFKDLQIEYGHKVTSYSPCWTDIFKYNNETINVNI